uniref:Uncharacterized protein n=1 Tax=Vespula pensylvanica TaxID=30213 RepID=A0A834PF32_VESPE|nr:hypothetical protein H0235_000880 [Vespula pensylvanica]
MAIRRRCSNSFRVSLFQTIGKHTQATFTTTNETRIVGTSALPPVEASFTLNRGDGDSRVRNPIHRCEDKLYEPQ